MSTVRGLHGGADLGVWLRGHTSERKCPRCGSGIGVLSVDAGFPRQVVQGLSRADEIRTVGPDREPVTSIGGLRVQPACALDDVRPGPPIAPC